VNLFLVSCKPVFYLPTAKSFRTVNARAKINKHDTTKQKNYETLERSTMLKALAKLDKNLVQVFDTAIKGNNSASLIITHLPLDLLSAGSFRKLVLLESHTGALKTKSEWITKLSKNENYRNIPFNILSVQVLGDRNNQFSSMGIK